MINKKFWKGKRVLITGHTGFKGSWLTSLLLNLGSEIVGYALDPPTEPSLFESAGIGNHIYDIRSDIRDKNEISNVIKRYKPEIVFHLAAQPIVLESYKDPLSTYTTNVIGTVNLFEAIRKATDVLAVVNVTTDKVYKNENGYWGYRESDPLGGVDPYSNSKVCSEYVTQSYRKAFFNDQGIMISSARAGNVIGGGDWAQDRLIPDIVRAFQKKTRIEIRYPDSIRPWQHVLDPLAGYLHVIQKMVEDNGCVFCDCWNFGPEKSDSISVQMIIEKMEKIWGEKLEWYHSPNEKPHEERMLRLDISKSKSLLGWSPVFGIDETLSNIVSFHKYSEPAPDYIDKTLSLYFDKEACTGGNCF